MEIIALTNLKKIDKSKVDVDSEGTPIDSNILVFKDDNNKWHLTGLDSQDFYIRNGEKFSFSTSEFDKLKDFLLKIIGANKISFAELINFKHEKGMISPICARKLSNDFLDFQPLVKSMNIEISIGFDKWMKAFSLASNKGVVIFD